MATKAVSKLPQPTQPMGELVVKSSCPPENHRGHCCGCTFIVLLDAETSEPKPWRCHRACHPHLASPPPRAPPLREIRRAPRRSAARRAQLAELRSSCVRQKVSASWPPLRWHCRKSRNSSVTPGPAEQRNSIVGRLSLDIDER